MENNNNLEQDLKEVFLIRKKLCEDYDSATEFVSNFHIDRRRKRIRIISIGSSLAAFLILAFWLFAPLAAPNNPEDIYFSYYSQIDADINLRDTGEYSIFDKGIQAYSDGNNPLAIELFGLVEQDLKSSPKFIFYLSLTLLDSGDIDEAKINFEGLLEQGNFMQSEVCWYLSLMEIKSGKYETAKRLLAKMKQIDPKAHRKDRHRIIRVIRFRKSQL